MKSNRSTLLSLFFILAIPAHLLAGFSLCCGDDYVMTGDELTQRVTREFDALTMEEHPSYDKSDIAYFLKVQEFITAAYNNLKKKIDRQKFLSELYNGQVTTPEYRLLPLCQPHLIKPDGTLLGQFVKEAIQTILSCNERGNKFTLMSEKQISALRKQGKKR